MAGFSTTRVISYFIGLIIVSAFMPVFLSNIATATNDSNMSSGDAILWALIPTVVIVGIIYGLFKELTS